MSYQKITLKEGIYFHKIQTNKFKTSLFAIFLTVPITRENVTKNALTTTVLRRGTNKMPTQEEISKKLEEMYGAAFDCGIEKTGDNHILKFLVISASPSTKACCGYNFENISVSLQQFFNNLSEHIGICPICFFLDC